MAREVSVGTTVTGRCAAGSAGRRVGVPLDAVATGSGLIMGDPGAGRTLSGVMLVESLRRQGLGCLVVDANETLAERLPAAFQPWRPRDRGPEAVERHVDTTVRDGESSILDLSATPEPGRYLDAGARALADVSRDADRRWIVVVSSLERYVPTAGEPPAAGETIGRLVAGGHSREIGLLATAASPGAVDPAVLEAFEWRLWHRLSDTDDRSIVRRLLDGEHARAVRDLGDTEAILEADWRDATDRVTVDRPDPQATGTADDELTGLREDIAEVLDRLDRIEDAIQSDSSKGIQFSPLESDSSERRARSNGDDESAAAAAMEGDDTLTALAGVTTDNEMGGSAAAEPEPTGLSGDGRPDLGSVSAEVQEFEAGVSGIEVEKPQTDDQPAVAVALESTLAELDRTEREQLRAYRSDGVLEPETAYRRATGHGDRVAAYTANRRLRRAGLIEHVGRGRYRYALEARVAAGLPGDRDARAAAITSDLETAHLA